MVEDHRGRHATTRRARCRLAPLYPWPLVISLFLVACGGGGGGGVVATANLACPSGVGGTGGTAELSWVPPTTNTDGSAVTLNSFNVYLGSSANSLEKIGSVGAAESTCSVVNLPVGTYFFAVTAVATNGLESEFSNTETKTILAI